MRINHLEVGDHGVLRTIYDALVPAELRLFRFLKRRLVNIVTTIINVTVIEVVIRWHEVEFRNFASVLS